MSKKRTTAIIEREFPKQYIAHGLNGTRAYKALKDRQDKPVSLKVAGVMATRLLEKDSVQRGIAEIMSGNGMDIESIQAIHRRNMRQATHLPTSQKAVETAYSLHGLLRNDTQGNTNIALIIER